jgi:hypothetical protein
MIVQEERSANHGLRNTSLNYHVSILPRYYSLKKSKIPSQLRGKYNGPLISKINQQRKMIYLVLSMMNQNKINRRRKNKISKLKK